MCTLFCKQKAERVRGSRPSARAKLSHQNREQQTETSDRQPMAKRTRNRKSPSVKPMLFTPGNYKLMGMGVLLVIVGFTIMRIENRSEEHTSELQSRGQLVCRLLLEKKNTL